MSGPGKPQYSQQKYQTYWLTPSHGLHDPVEIYAHEDDDGWHGWLIVKGKKPYGMTTWAKLCWLNEGPKK